MVGMRRRLMAVVVLAVVAPLALSGCGDKQQPAAAAGASAGPSDSASPGASGPAPESATVPIELSVTPTAGKTGVPVSAEIGFKVTGAKVTSVTLTGSDGKAVPGALRDDGSSWVPGKTLKTKERYAASVVATSDSGLTKTVRTTFTTMGAPGRKTGTGLYLFDNHTYGVGMPVVAEFNPGIKKADRAAVQKRMFVQTDPPQPGVWSWTSSGTQAYYRAPQFWQPGTKLTVRIAVGGVPTGGGRYGDRDRSATAKIGRDFEMKVDNATKKMTVTQDGKVVRTALVSLGRPSKPSVSGTMVVMDKLTETVFDTTDTDGAAGYKTKIQYAQRITWSGQYVHSAPWSVGAQGHRNVSHGCVNVSPSNAKWLFDKTLIGDPVIVTGTGSKLAYGDGWTAWNVSWPEFVKGSALPVPPSLK
ncbi:L,D-transpeptidase [Paractinoplanes globisporus]|uniref:Ig-like domain-containing protein n=1 Tax=Paractinoplanes globisporus TaxID=113565 RepID=A0ABW6WCG4_9ACTN|nr:Ig-like domain-containing protein [Actinoplanes globisporus]